MAGTEINEAIARIESALARIEVQTAPVLVEYVVNNPGGGGTVLGGMRYRLPQVGEEVLVSEVIEQEHPWLTSRLFKVKEIRIEAGDDGSIQKLIATGSSIPYLPG